MASSDYEMGLSDDEHRAPNRNNGPGKATKAVATKPKEKRAAWEAIGQKNWDLHEGDDGNLEVVLGGLEEASKRAR